MVELNIIITIFSLCFLSFFDIIIFNEEILLTLCFLSFLFYCFNTLSDSVSSSFESQAAKFEQDLLFSFNVSKVSLLNDFDTHSKLQSFIGQFTILLLSLSAFLAKALLFVEQAPLFTFYLTCLSKVNELALVNGSFVKSFQKACVVKLLYSLILKKSTNDVKTYIAGSTSIKSFNILTELKNLSI